VQAGTHADAADARGTDLDGGGRQLDALPWLAELRADERERATARFRRVVLMAGDRWVAAADAPPALGVVLAGCVSVTRAIPGMPSVPVRLWSGDRWDEVAVFADLPGETIVESDKTAAIALLDRAAFLALVAEFPIVWLAVSERLSRELKTTSDLLREIQEVEASETRHASLSRFLYMKRRLVGRRAGIARAATHDLFRRFVGAHVREPTFWVLAGFAAAILVSRAVVAAIVGLGLQQRLFNLRDSGGPNPLHMHHFNYGFAIIAVTGLLAFFPRSGRTLRVLAAAFGVGLGLVFDEFALIWKLDPDYYQPLNYWAQALLAATLIQVVYFRGVYADFAALVLARLGRRT
jgi:CRP-like cAMP-binding protein